jgi:hypothetical protein
VTGAPAEYRIEYDVDNRAPWARLSTDTRTVWTFSSRPSDAIVTQPLLTVGWDAKVDLRNRLRGRRLDLRVAHQPGAPAIPVRSVALDVSYDDGVSWRPARLHRRGSRWRARLDPRGEFVSLRLRAVDVRGNAIEQRILRAFATGMV